MVFPLIDDMEISENGVLSFENPNYVLRHTFADGYNSNSTIGAVADYQSDITDRQATKNNLQSTATNHQPILTDKSSTEIDNQSTNIDNQSTNIDNQPTKIDNQSTKIDNQSTKIDNQSTKIDNQPTKIDNQSTNTDLQSAITGDASNKTNSNSTTAENNAANALPCDVANKNVANAVAATQELNHNVVSADEVENTSRVVSNESRQEPRAGAKKLIKNNEILANFAALDDGLTALESLSSSLEQVCELSRSCSHRRRYAQLRPDSMGVDLHHGPVTNLDNRSPQMVDSGAAGDGGGVPHIVAGEGQELYALPMKGPRAGGDGPPEPQVPQQHSGSFSSSASTTSSSSSSTGSPPADPQQELPPGWERHEDNDGPYYWHIKSGTITRTPPAPTSSRHPPPPPAHRRNKDEQMGVPRSTTSSALVELAELRPRSTNTPENAYKRRSYPVRSELTEAGCGRAVRFAVRSLGWLEVAEEELTPERSSRAVNRCIVDLSVGRRDVMDVVGCWGEGKDLFMDLDEGSLKLVDPENLTLLNSQPIHTIRVWGVGRDNGRERDFAYVARDRVSRKHMCHVFRCDTPARVIANTLRDICKKIMIERSLKGDLGSQLGSSNSLAGNNNNNNSVSSNNNNNNTSPLGRATRPSNLPTEHRRLQRHNSLMQGQSFPTPMEEPRKVVRAQYVGLLQVSRPSGMEVINRAIQDAVTSNPGPWDTVLVAVAPSTITISDAKDNSLITECRVRFLSFLGIGRNVHHCAFIMHNAQDQFVAHVFFCEPSSGALCKTIEAACKLRYQKCLDAHPSGGAGALGAGGRGGDQRGGVAATLRSVFTSLAGGRGRRGAAS